MARLRGSLRVTKVDFIRPGTKALPKRDKLERLYAKRPSDRFQEFSRRFLTHVKGPKTGQSIKFARWQVERIIRPLFDTVLPDGRRQYRTVYLNIPRKCGKSTLGAAVALYLLYADDEGGADIISAAGSVEQAAVIFDMASSMVARSPALREMSSVYRREIRVPSLGARYKVISAEAGTAHGLNLHGAIIDELHVWESRELYDALTTSMGGREQPITFIATTAGDNELSICAEVHRHAEQVRDGVVTNTQLLPVIYAAPDDADWQDERVWHAANPALGDFRSLEEMRQKAQEARDIPGRESPFRRLYLNQWGAAAAPRWLPLAKWDACRVDGPGPSRGRRVYLGLDLAATRDLTALVLVCPEPDGRMVVRAEFWCPEDTVRERTRKDRVPYDLWCEQGFLTPTEGSSVDYGAVEARIRALLEQYEVVEVAVDPWNAYDLVHRLQRDGVPIVAVPQTMQGLTSAAKRLERLLLNGQLVQDGHPVLRWCVVNAVADTDSNGNLKPSKKLSREKIDGLSALVTALARVAMDEPSVYTERYQAGDPVLTIL